MNAFGRIISAAAALVIAAALAPPCPAQQPLTVPGVQEIIGLENLKHDLYGRLTIGKGALEFSAGKKKASLPVTAMDDVITGTESQRVVGGTLGTLTSFAPYAGGRFLSLFRTKEDTITIFYHDEAGGIHGAVFMMSAGHAAQVKKELVAEGAHASVAPEAAPAEQKEKKQ